MRLTTMTDYSLRLLMYLGQHPDRLCTIAEIAGAYGISEAHLMKITHVARGEEWLASVPKQRYTRALAWTMRVATRSQDAKAHSACLRVFAACV